jgi:ADP-heptose:LPS heptosyltransferase
MLVWFKWISPTLRRSVRERILDCLAPLEVPVVSTETQLFPFDANIVLSTFSIDPTKKLVGIAPGAKHRTKAWNPERFAEAANRLGAAPNTHIVLLGSKSDQAAARKVAEGLRRIHSPLVR